MVKKNNVIVKEFGTSSSTISTIWKNRDTLKIKFKTTPLQAKQLCTVQHKVLEEAVQIWFKQQQQSNVSKMVVLYKPILTNWLK